MLERFLVPLDTSEVSEHVLPYVELFAKKLGQPVHLLIVADDGQVLQLAPQNVSIRAIVEERRATVAKYVKRMRERLETAGVTVTTEIAIGHVVDTILSTANRRSVGMIAMATHGRVGPERWFLGSVTDRVVRGATMPLFLVRPSAERTAPIASIERIILPLDGSLLAEAAIPHATFVAKTFDRPIVLVRTLDLTRLTLSSDPSVGDYPLPVELQETLRADATNYLEQTAARIRESGLTVERVFSFKQPGQEIAHQAHDGPGALIVMSTHGRSGLGRTVLGSVADRVIRTAEAPVLLVRGVPQD
ncbi:MAG TPA: universal stress protein [Chloroflexota bacterium]|jgi:nucleotide-binding universal stress UspA family protein|nr:universal stress protein [Chloroflexota bacterium]